MPPRRFLSLLVLLVPTIASAQEKSLTTMYYGVKVCLKCHFDQTLDGITPEKVAKFENDPKITTSRQIEINFWLKHDKHKDAANVLTNERSKQIAKIMNLRPDLIHEARCANCHGVFIDPAKEKELIDEDSFTGDDRLKSGVSCVACHGPVLEWVNEHAAPLPKKKWATRSRAEKRDEFGLRDLWNPVTRAELCVSCHVGNLEQGKFVTHEMYAAGHPPLPSIEIATFSEAMPAHWESLTQKAARARQNPDARNGKAFLKNAYGVDADAMDMEHTRLVAVASLVSARATVDLIGEYAKRSEANKDNYPWPELAFYDCAACHHELKTKSWRIDRGYAGGKPGRPGLATWPFALAPFADATITLPFKATFDKTPFGDPKEIATEAAALRPAFNKAIAACAADGVWTRAAAEKAAADIASLAKTNLHDFHSARQFTWALRTLAQELNGGGKYGPATLPTPLLDRFGALDKSLMLRLPEGQVEIVPTMGDKVFNLISNYDPREFRKTMEEIAPLVHGKHQK